VYRSTYAHLPPAPILRPGTSSAYRGGWPIATQLPLHGSEGGCYGDKPLQLKFTLAQLLVARGEYRQAYIVLEHWRWDADTRPSFALATLETERIAERLRERENSIKCYMFVTDV
jgi:hypothetical protein